MTDLPIVIATWPKGKDQVRVQLNVYNNRPIVDARVWYTDAGGELRPSPKGLTLGVAHLPTLTNAITKALEAAKNQGLISGDDRQPPGVEQSD